ncbi:MAG: hypothetical protein Q8L29_01260 [archaeon]|nr:hypothetical protein [archaeon]
MLDYREEKESKIENLILKTSKMVSSVFGGILAGGVSSLFNPFFIPQTYQNMRKIKDNLIAYNIMATSAIAGYIAGTGCIAYNLIENPSKPSSYIPILGNIIGGLLMRKNSKD